MIPEYSTRKSQQSLQSTDAHSKCGVGNGPGVVLNLESGQPNHRRRNRSAGKLKMKGGFVMVDVPIKLSGLWVAVVVGPTC